MRWVGIDEAGYGPNLGPMVMTAVVAESTEAPSAPASADAPRSISGATWRRPSIGPAAIPTGSGSTIRRRSCRGARAATGSKSPAWRRSTRPGSACRAAWPSCSTLLGAGSLEDIELSPWTDGRQTDEPGVAAPADRDALDALVDAQAAGSPRPPPGGSPR